MLITLFLIPLLATASSMFIYQLNGKRELLRLDIVQFFYAFVLSPALFIWLKSFLYLLVKSELKIVLSQTEMFIIDTAFSVVFLYIFAFIVMHSLTKSFNLKKQRDPLYDIFHHSEYFHLWLTHLVMHLGGLLLLNILALINLAFPMDIEISRKYLLPIVGSGIIGGILFFLGMWLSDPKQESANYMRVMKLAAGILFLMNVTSYFVFDIPFSPQYSFYWWNSFVLAAFVSLSLFAYKSERAQTLFERTANWFKHRGWEFRIQVFEKINKK
jgi:hypothetical protein